MFANRELGNTDTATAKDIERLSSGYRINRAADDASGLAVSEKMRSQIRGLNQANRNIQNGVSFIQTTEGYLAETTDILQRLRELAVQSANGIYTDEDRMQIQVEVSQLVDEVNRIASHAQFNGMNLLTGRFAQGGPQAMVLQVGANVDQHKQIFIGDMSANALFGAQQLAAAPAPAGEGGAAAAPAAAAAAPGSTGLLDLSSSDKANSALATLDNALMTVSKQRADLGAYQNRFETASNGIQIAAENMQGAESRIRDVDMASEMVDYTKNQILSQSGVAMLAQANVRNQAVLSLLG
jgi:flagellin